MELKHLKAFLMLAEELHYGRAASRLHIAQPQLSQWIRRLEADLGVPLFDRSTRSVRLTDQGAAIVEPARETLERAHAVELAARMQGPGVSGRVRVGYPGASSRAAIQPLGQAVRTGEPGIELDLRSMLYSGTTPGLVAAGDLDIGFSRLPVTQPGVEWRIVGYERLLAALPAEHRLARRETVAMRDLAKEPWVAFPAGKGSTVRDAGLLLAHEQGLLPRIVQEAPDSYAILALVAAGVGVTLTLSSVGHITNPGLVYRELAGEPTYLATVILWGPRPGRATRRVLEILERLLPTPPQPEGRVLG